MTGFFLAVDIVNMTSVLFLNRNETIFLKLQTKHINGIHGPMSGLAFTRTI